MASRIQLAARPAARLHFVAMGMTPVEILAAERRIQRIKDEIQVILASDGPFEERVARWEALLTESLQLQERLDKQG